MFKHLRVVLRLIAVSLILSSFIWGVDKVSTSDEKLEYPVLSNAGGNEIVPVNVILVDESSDVGPTYVDRAPASDSSPMIVHWAESASGVFGGIRCENREKAWSMMRALVERNLDGSGRIYSVWMTREISSATREVDRPTTTALHLERVLKLNYRLRYLSDYSRVESHDNKIISALLQEVSRLDNERELLLANLCDEFAENPRGYDEFVANVIVPVWRELADSWQILKESLVSRATSPAAYTLH